MFSMNCIRRRALAVGAFRRSFRVARQLFPGQVGERHLGRTVLAAVGSVSSTPSVPREFSERAASSRISAIWYYSRCRGNSRAHASLLNPGWKKSTGRWSAPPPHKQLSGYCGVWHESGALSDYQLSVLNGAAGRLFTPIRFGVGLGTFLKPYRTATGLGTSSLHTVACMCLIST